MMQSPYSFVFVLMLLGHMVADYTLQGWLANGKCKSWWEKQCTPEEMEKYKNDYRCAMLCHAFYWSAITFMPLLLLSRFSAVAQFWYTIIVLVNTPIHYLVDDLKANKRAITLWTDQGLHLFQIAMTLVVWRVLI